MKLHILSDLHFEFQKWPARIDVNAIDADVTILAGDIGVGLDGVRWALDRIARPVIYVMGNHEYFGRHAMAEILGKARVECAGTHVHVLDNDATVIDGVRFLGTTLWADFALFGAARREEMMAYAHVAMADYSLIHGTRDDGTSAAGRPRPGDPITPRTTLALHEAGRHFLERQLAQDNAADGDEAWRATVVVTHHAPSARSLADHEPCMPDEAAYASHLDALVAQADLWVHGHIHAVSDYPVGNGRVVANPRGYVDDSPDSVAGYDPCRVVVV